MLYYIKLNYKKQNKKQIINSTSIHLNYQAQALMVIQQKLRKSTNILLARYQLQSYIHPILYLFFYFLAGIHFWIAVLQPQNQISEIFKYLDLSNPIYISFYDIVMYPISFFILLHVMWILRQLYVSIKFQKMQMSAWEKYGMKIFSSIGMLLSTVLMLTILRLYIFYISRALATSQTGLNQASSNSTNNNTSQELLLQFYTNKYKTSIDYSYYFSMVCLILYLFIILPFEIFFISDLQPFSSNQRSSLSFLNILKILSFFRIILCFVNVLQTQTHFGYSIGIFPILIFWMIKYPFILYNKYEKILKVIIYGTIYVMFIRIVYLTEQALSGEFIIVFFGCFIGTMIFVVQYRISNMVYQQQQLSQKSSQNKNKSINESQNQKQNYTQISVQSIKIIVSMLAQFENNMKFLPLFLLSHQENCDNTECNCKIQKMKTLCQKQNLNLWFQILSNIIEKNYSINEIREMPKSKKIKKLKKYQDISIVYSSFISKKLGKYNKALYILDAAKVEFDKLNFTSFHFRTYYQRFKHQMQIKMIYKSKKQNNINKYAKNYIDYQIKLIRMNNLIRNSVKIHFNLYNEMTKNQPDESKVIQEIIESYKYNEDINKIVKDIMSISVEIHPLLFPYISLYYKNVCNIQISKPQRKQKNRKQNKQKQKQKQNSIQIKKMSENSKKFSYDSQTAICTVKICNTPELGDIIYNNIYFQKFLGFTKNDDNADSLKKLNMDDLIPFPFRKIHRKKQEKFILSGSCMCMAQNIKALLVKKQGYILDTIMSFQIHSSLKQGLVAQVFFFPMFLENQDSILLCNQKGQILYYSQIFQQNILETLDQQSLQMFNQTLRYQILVNLQKYNLSELCLKFQSRFLEITLRRKFYDEEKGQNFYVMVIDYLKANILLQIIENRKENKSSQYLSQENDSENNDIRSQKKNKTVVFIQNYNENSANGSENSAIGSDNDNKKISKLKTKKSLYKAPIDIKKQQQNNFHDLKAQLKLKTQKQKLQGIFKIMGLKQSKLPKIIIFWGIIILFLTIAILIFILCFNSLTNQKINLVRDANKSNGRYQKINIFLLDAFYHLRRANIQSKIYKNEQKFEYHRKKFEQYKKSAVQLYTNIISKPKLPLISYGLNPSTKLIQIQQDSSFFLTIDWHILSRLTNLATAKMQDFNFQIDKNKIQPPYNNFKVNFIQANINGLHQIFPNFKTIKDIKYKQLNCMFGGQSCFFQQKIIFFIVVCIIIVILILFSSYYIIIKITLIKNKTLQIIQTLSYDELILRKGILKKYIKQYFPQDKQKKITQLRQRNKQKVLKIQQKYNNKTLKAIPFNTVQVQLQNNNLNVKKQRDLSFSKQENNNNKKEIKKLQNQAQKKQIINTNKKFQSIKQIQQNNKDLSQNFKSNNNNTITIKQQYQNPNTKNKIKKTNLIHTHIQFKKQNQKKIKYYTIIISIILIILLSIFLIYFVLNTNNFTNYFQNKNLIYQQSRLIKQIKLYTIQLGLDDGTIYYKQSKSIAKNLQEIISLIYEVQHNLTNRYLNKNSNFKNQKLAQIMFDFNQYNVCKQLFELNIKEDQYVNVNQDNCSNIQGKSYLTQGRRSALMAYLQIARILWMNNSVCQPCSQSHQLNFLNNSSLSLMEQLDYYFTGISQYQAKIHSQSLQTKIQLFKQQVYIQIGILSFLTPLFLVILWILLKRKIKNDLLLIKSIFHIISNETIKKNTQIKEIIIQKIDYQFLK